MKKPRVSIGLPVYNGENYLKEAVQSLLSQTFEDFELLISDNASTDQTGKICRRFAELDQRIKYVRNAENIGLTRNFNQVFTLSAGEYFKWADHDDLCQPDFLLRCVGALDDNPSSILAYSRAISVDGKRNVIKEWESRPELCSSDVAVRFRRALKQEEPFPQSGLIRADMLRRTRLLGTHVQSDIILLAELSLLGPFVEIPDPLFMVREHPQRSTRTHDWQDSHNMPEWMDPKSKKSVTLLEWELLLRLLSAVHRSQLTWTSKRRCYGEVYRWTKPRKELFLQELVHATRRIPILGALVEKGHAKYKKAAWNHQLRLSRNDVAAVIPLHEIIILVDEAKCSPGVFGPRQMLPFLERNGEYGGIPPDSLTAIHDVERLRQSGAAFMVFTWSTFWWLEFYSDLHRYLRSKFRCVTENARVVIFDLRDQPQVTVRQ